MRGRAVGAGVRVGVGVNVGVGRTAAGVEAGERRALDAQSVVADEIAERHLDIFKTSIGCIDADLKSEVLASGGKCLERGSRAAIDPVLGQVATHADRSLAGLWKKVKRLRCAL